MFAITLLITALLSDLAHARECGKQQHQPGEFIVGGQDAKPGDFPWFVELRVVNKTSGFESRCGGAYIEDGWVLTAAHCVMELTDRPDLYTAYIDVYDLESKDIVKHTAKVIKLVPNESFNISYDSKESLIIVRNDIGLVKIDLDSLPIRDSLMPICLPNANVTLANDCWVAGMGLQGNSVRDWVTKLKKLQDFVSDDRECLKLNKYFDTQSQLCIGGTAKGGTGVCSGDSGSAFLCRATDNKFYHLGITSYTLDKKSRCAQPNTPDVFMNTSYYLEWIEKTIKHNS